MPVSALTDPWSVGSVRVRRVRGPRPDGLTYWRATLDGEQLWAGWCRREDPAVAAELVRLARGGAREEAPRGDRVLDLLAAYRADVEQRAATGEIAAGTRASYVSAIRYLATGLADVRIDALDSAILRTYLDDRRRGRIQPAAITRPRDYVGSWSTLRIEWQVLAQAWTWARRRGLTERLLDLPRIRGSDRVISDYTPTVEEVDLVIAAVARPWVAQLIRLLRATGARIGEAVDLTWGDIDLDRSTIALDGKTGRRVIPLRGEAREVIDELADGLLVRPAADSVWPVERSTAMHQSGVYVRLACDEIGVEPWTLHALRRLAVDRLYEAGADVGVAAKLLGQSPSVALKHYRRPRPDALAAALDAAGMGEREGGEVLQLSRHRSTSQGQKSGGRGSR